MSEPDRFTRAGQMAASLRRGLPWLNSQERGPNGGLLCRRCGEEVKPPRRTWCSEECVEVGQIYFGNRWYMGKVARANAGGHCPECGVDLSRIVWEVHHIVPLAEGGWNEPANMIALCSKCHGAKTREQARRRARPRPEPPPELSLEDAA